MTGGRVSHESAPAAADVEHPHAGLETQLLADQLQLGLLRLVQRVRAFPVAAGVSHARAEHGLIEIIAKIVVSLADLPGALGVLAVEDALAQHGKKQAQRFHLPIQLRPQDVGEEIVELVRIPVAVHVGFSQAEAAARDDPLQHVRRMKLDVPGAGPIELDVGPG